MDLEETLDIMDTLNTLDTMDTLDTLDTMDFLNSLDSVDTPDTLDIQDLAQTVGKTTCHRIICITYTCTWFKPIPMYMVQTNQTNQPCLIHAYLLVIQ